MEKCINLIVEQGLLEALGTTKLSQVHSCPQYLQVQIAKSEGIITTVSSKYETSNFSMLFASVNVWNGLVLVKHDILKPITLWSRKSTKH